MNRQPIISIKTWITTKNCPFNSSLLPQFIKYIYVKNAKKKKELPRRRIRPGECEWMSGKTERRARLDPYWFWVLDCGSSSRINGCTWKIEVICWIRFSSGILGFWICFLNPRRRLKCSVLVGGWFSFSFVAEPWTRVGRRS